MRESVRGWSGLVLVAGLLAALGACRSSPPTTFHVLSPLASEGGETSGRAPGRLLAVSVSGFPEYLDRGQLVRSRTPNTLAVAETDAWAEPLSRGFARVLSEDLARLTGRPAVVLGPLSQRVRDGLVIELEVASFDVGSAAEVELVATWLVADAAGELVVPPRRTRLAVPVEGEASDAAIAAQSEALARLAREIAAALP